MDGWLSTFRLWRPVSFPEVWLLRKRHRRVPGLISSLWNPQDPERLAKLRAGAPVGGLFEWSPRTGIRELEETKTLSAPNGVIASPDGKFVFVAVWSGKALARIDRSVAKFKVDQVETGFLTD
jgi:sugar lactone lactonase YvrE